MGLMPGKGKVFKYIRRNELMSGGSESVRVKRQGYTRRVWFTMAVVILLTAAIPAVVLWFVRAREYRSVFLDKAYQTTLRIDCFSLMAAYPEHIIDIERTMDHRVYLILKSGKRLLYDDARTKSEDELLNNPDLQDMMAQLYVLGPIDGLMPEDFNPGRIRVYPLLKEVYGASQQEVERNLTGVQIQSGSYRFNKNNRAAASLETAMREIHQLTQERPEAWPYIFPTQGTYNYRYISRTRRLSPHAFGTSIDFATNPHDYWQWTTREKGEKRVMDYPQELVWIMEDNDFIWGGKWGHFDIFHFEYRPEILIKARYFAEPPKALWYETLPMEDPRVSAIVRLIEDRLAESLPAAGD